MSTKTPFPTEDEDADPVGTPVGDAAARGPKAGSGSSPSTATEPDAGTDADGNAKPKPRDLDQEQADFTAEGSPPPGKVATTPPAAPGVDPNRVAD